MGVDNSINVKKMRERAEKIHERAMTMGTRLQNVFDDIKELQQYWKGQAYVDFAKKVNHLDDNFARIDKYFCSTLPKEICKKANVYAKAQGEKKVAVANYGMSVFENVPIKGQGDDLVFKEEKVQSIQDRIEKRFANVENDLQKLSDLFDQIPWQGTAKTTTKKLFNNNVDEVLKTMKTIKNALKKNMQAAINANRKAEEGNSTSSAAEDISSVSTIASGMDTASSALEGENYDWKSNT